MRLHFVLLFISSLLFFAGIVSRDLWNPDEPRYAQVAKEMDKNSSYFVPLLNGEIYSQKPPFFFWSVIFFAKFLGFNELSARIPSALAAIAVTLLIFIFAKREFGENVGFLSALIFISTAKIIWQGHVGQIDMLLLLWVTLSYITIWFFIKHRKKGYFYLFFFLGALATLTKGPAGFIPPLVSLVIYIFINDKTTLKKLPWLKAFALWIVVISFWLVPAVYMAGEVYAREILLKQNITRYMDPWHHFRPWYYYFSILPGDFFPWFFFLGYIFINLEKLKENKMLQFLVIWVSFTLFFFSLSPAKRSVYIVQIYPALAILLGFFINESDKQNSKIAKLFTFIPSLVLLLGAVYIFLAYDKYAEIVDLIGSDTTIMVAIAFFIVGLFFLIAAFHSPVKHSYITASSMILLGIFIFTFILPRFNPIKSPREISDYISTNLRDKMIAIYPRLDANLLFYSNRYMKVINDSSEIKNLAEEENCDWCIVVKAKKVDLSIFNGWKLLKKDRDIFDPYHLYCYEGDK